MSQQIQPHPRGLPCVLFIEDEETFLNKAKFNEEQAILEMRAAFQQLRTLYEQYKQRKESLNEKIPETEKAISMVHHLKKQKEAEKDVVLQYELIGGVFTKARIPPAGTVSLWLGANTMVEYTLDEADVFLSKTLLDAEESLKITNEDLRHLEDQMNTLEVNINRMHNYGMGKRRAKLAKEMQQQQQMQQAQLQAAALQQQQEKSQQQQQQQQQPKSDK